MQKKQILFVYLIMLNVFVATNSNCMHPDLKNMYKSKEIQQNIQEDQRVMLKVFSQIVHECKQNRSQMTNTLFKVQCSPNIVQLLALQKAMASDHE